MKIGSQEWFYEKSNSENSKQHQEMMESRRTQFLDKFAPERLSEMDGDTLLVKVFGPSNSSMMYLLMFDEYYRWFGAAGKYVYTAGLYYDQSKRTWKYKQGQEAIAISPKEAKDKALYMRDKLIFCVRSIQDAGVFKSINDYKRLNQRLSSVFFSQYSWALKYYQMIFPQYFPGMYADHTLNRALQILGLRNHGDKLLNAGEISLFIRHCKINCMVFGNIYGTQWGWEKDYPPCEAASENLRLSYLPVDDVDISLYSIPQNGYLSTNETNSALVNNSQSKYTELESLCQRLDSSITLETALKRKAYEFARYVQTRDKSDGKIDFDNSKSVLSEESYKHRLFERAQRALEINSWDETWIGTGKIFDKILPVILDNDNNLINNFNNKTDFNDHFRKGKDKYDSRSERAVFEIYKGSNERKAFEFAMDVFGRKYPTLGYLFFLKDDTRFLPLSPENFEKSFRELNINIKLQNNCDWDNYQTFIKIIDCIRKILPSLLDLEHEPTLLEAHSFVWIIGRTEFTSWLKGHEIQKKKAAEEQRQQQEKEEREKNREKRILLSNFSDEELLRMGPQIVNHVINNTLRGAAKVLSFSEETPLSMVITYLDDDSDSKPKKIELKDAKKNYYFTEAELNLILNNPEEDVRDTSINDEITNQIVIPESEEEQIEQAAALSVDQLRAIAEEHETEGPVRRDVTTKQYKRDPYIAELAKREANGICQLCGMDAPFITPQGKPYLETHHIKWLSEGGSDTVENTVAVCPNCHRRLHILNDPDDVDFLKSLKGLL